MEATILYGNGLNLISQPQKTWTKLLKELFDKYGNDLIPDHKPYRSSDFKIILRPIMILRWKNSLRKMDMHGNTTGKKLSTAFLLTWK